jgi:hypothetical protein
LHQDSLGLYIWIQESEIDPQKRKMRFHSLKRKYSPWRIGSLLVELPNPPWRPRNKFIAVFEQKKIFHFFLGQKESFWVRNRDPDSPKSLDLDPNLMKWIRTTV